METVQAKEGKETTWWRRGEIPVKSQSKPVKEKERNSHAEVTTSISMSIIEYEEPAA